MIINKIITNDLISINSAAKALKQKNFVLYNNMLYGIDDQRYIVYTLSIPLQDFIPVPIQFETKELSAFVKNIAFEEYFMTGSMAPGVDYINNIKGTNLRISTPNMYVFDHIINTINNINNNIYNGNTRYEIVKDFGDITDNIAIVFNLKKADGSIFLNINEYYMTFFYGLLPLNKQDKVSLTIVHHLSENSFIGVFTINKKGITVKSMIAFRIIPSITGVV